MNENEKLEKVKEIILDECQKAGVVVDRIILFGSRARGDNREDSDFDIYVIIDDDLEFSDIMNIFLKIKRGLAKLHISNDVIIRSRDIFEKNKTCIGFISYYVNKEGMNIWKKIPLNSPFNKGGNKKGGFWKEVKKVKQGERRV